MLRKFMEFDLTEIHFLGSFWTVGILVTIVVFAIIALLIWLLSKSRIGCAILVIGVGVETWLDTGKWYWTALAVVFAIGGVMWLRSIHESGA
ncbi:MAG: hypothetical protein IK126_06235 [Bacteroidales bacterium]|nr:hypothetical protein [Bacteroidales bacterium]